MRTIRLLGQERPAPGGAAMRNQNGVVVELTSTTQGANLKLLG
jgi:hypothetical protein